MADILISQALEIRLNAHLDKQITTLQTAIDDRLGNLTNICCNQEHQIHQLHCKFEDRLDMLQRTLSEIARSLITAMDSDLSRKHWPKRNSGSFKSTGLVLSSTVSTGQNVSDATEGSEHQGKIAGHTAASEPVRNEGNMRILLPFFVEWRSLALSRQRTAKNNVKERMDTMIRSWRRYAPPRDPDVKAAAADSSSDGENSNPGSDIDSAPSEILDPASLKCRRKGLADLVSCRRMFGDAEDEDAQSTRDDPIESGEAHLNPLAYCSVARLAEALLGISGPNVWLGHNGSRAVHPNSPFAAGPPPLPATTTPLTARRAPPGWRRRRLCAGDGGGQGWRAEERSRLLGCVCV